MAESYLKRHDVGYPRQPNPRGIYAVKYFENEDPVALSDIINVYLLALPEATASWVPHLVSTEFGHYVDTAPPKIIHTAWITLFATGTITVSPTG